MKGCDIKSVNTSKQKIPEKVQLSVVLISLNEAANIARALDSVSWADDVVVYDSGSTDSTVEIAKKMGANVIEGEWLGFGKTKKLASGFAKFDWVLSIDCDEELSAGLAEEIALKLPELNTTLAYRVPRLSNYLGRWIRYGGWYPDLQARLFNRKFSNWNEAEIHEKVEAAGYENLAACLNHYVFKNIEAQVRTNNRYSSLQAAEMHSRQRKFSWFHFFTKPSVKFIECYVLKRGFLDGYAGFVIAANAKYSVFLKWTKLRELEMRKTR